LSLIANHPFVDGNKRIGHAAMEVLLVLNGYEIDRLDRRARTPDDLLGSAKRPVGDADAKLVLRSAVIHPVSIGPGSIPLTVTPDLNTSAARLNVRASNPAFVTAYATSPGIGPWFCPDVMLMIRPPRGRSKRTAGAAPRFAVKHERSRSSRTLAR